MAGKNGAIYEVMSMILHEGAQAARVTLVEGGNTSITLLNGEPDSMQNATNRALHLNIFTDGRYGVFTTNRLDTDDVRRFIRNAVRATRLLVPDECRVLPPKSICYDGKGFDLKINDSTYPEITSRQKMEILQEVISGIPSDPRLISTESQYEDEYLTETVIDSNGLEISESRTSFSVSTECTVRD
ncbi:MAG: hypothetical protein KBS57_03075, partial [Alistipes sp.]|nr:hypothetical protein [Candidatus Minthomonas equi]